MINRAKNRYNLPKKRKKLILFWMRLNMIINSSKMFDFLIM